MPANPTPEIAEDLAAVEQEAECLDRAACSLKVRDLEASKDYTERASALRRVARLATPPKVASDAEELVRRAADAEIAKYTGDRRSDEDIRFAMRQVKNTVIAATASLAVEIEALRRERDAAYNEAKRLAEIMCKRWYWPVGNWKPLEYTAGVISQIDNMVAGLGIKLDEAEASRLAAERNLEAAAGESGALREENRLLQVVNNRFRNDYLDADQRALIAEGDLSSAVEVLRYYAEEDHYDSGDVPGHTYVLDDHGRYARTFLAAMNTGADDAE